jgi:hypothetical protein
MSEPDENLTDFKLRPCAMELVTNSLLQYYGKVNIVWLK